MTRNSIGDPACRVHSDKLPSPGDACCHLEEGFFAEPPVWMHSRIDPSQGEQGRDWTVCSAAERRVLLYA